MRQLPQRRVHARAEIEDRFEAAFRLQYFGGLLPDQCIVGGSRIARLPDADGGTRQGFVQCPHPVGVAVPICVVEQYLQSRPVGRGCIHV